MIFFTTVCHSCTAINRNAFQRAFCMHNTNGLLWFHLVATTAFRHHSFSSNILGSRGCMHAVL